jgi:ATP-dependent Lon protease
MPEENLYDLKDVAQEVRDKIEIIPVSRVTDLLEAVGILQLAAA